MALTVAALQEAGLRRHRVGVGDGSLYHRLLVAFGVPAESHTPLLAALSRRDLVGLELEVSRLGLGGAERDLLLRLPELRGGREVLDRVDGPAAEAAEGPSPAVRAAGRARRGRPGDLRPRPGAAALGYYTGAVFEVYDPAVGFALGRRWPLRRPARALRPRPARLRHRARRAARARGPGRRGGAPVSDHLMIAVPRGALFEDTLDLLERLGTDVSEVRANDRQPAVRRARDRDHAPERRAHLRGARLRGHRDHRQGRAARAGGARGVRAASTWATGSAA